MILRRLPGAVGSVALLLLVKNARCGSDTGLPVTAPTSLEPGKQATFGWELVNKHEVTESKGLTTARFMWFAQDTTVGDQIQFWVYDSKGAEGKSPNIPIVAAASSASKSASGGGGKASSYSHSASERLSKGSAGVTAGGGRSASGKETHTADSSSASITTAAGTGSSPASNAAEAPDELSTAPSAATASTATPAPVAPAATAAATASPLTAPAAVSTAPASSSISTVFSGDKTTLYLGVGGVALALILIVALLLYMVERKAAR
ncbi:hypothetical protein Rt10032_c01g0481 [Rhodotorula toruloides]|uniref:Uncharacterized protein n=1 Tax=Rhodotorula toruloides TaxID=5286 RepID=A0A511KAH7_RHOTO|nr:hypothetical protein Rt10032_c01g0481 [Rhodotorula toruloides]